MRYIESIKFPDIQLIDKYMNSDRSFYPWTIFFYNGLETISCKDITMLYGNNGSGKSTILNLIASTINANRCVDIYKDIYWVDSLLKDVCPYDDMVKYIKYEMDYDGQNKIQMPSNRKMITSDDIFAEIARRVKHNNIRKESVDKARQEINIILERGYQYKSMKDIDQLNALLEARKMSKRDYIAKYSSRRENMMSNGETALEYFSKEFENGGIFLLDEPENCLSPVYQLELMQLIQDATTNYDCQFIISTHSPILLSMDNSFIYNLDRSPVTIDKWSDLENVEIYHDFFKKHDEDFK